MRHTRRGQTLVEFALVLPILLAIMMGIIDMSYMIFNWSQIQFGVRRGAEQASKLPPREVRASYDSGYAGGDACYREILRETKGSGAFSTATAIRDDEIFVRFLRDSGGTSTNLSRFSYTTSAAERKLLGVVEVRVQHTVVPLTPLGETVFGNSVVINAMSRRTIISLNSPSLKCN